MLMPRSWFFLGLFFFLVGPFFVPKVTWWLCSRRTAGKVLFTGGVLDPINGTKKYLVMQFRLGKDSVEFQSNMYFRWPEDTVVMVRYSRFDPYDARIDLPVCIWGDTLVNVLLPLGVWLVLLLTPNRFDPLVPWGAKVRLGRRWPCIRVIPPVVIGNAGTMEEKSDLANRMSKKMARIGRKW
jgi:hypothetical protein